MQIKDLTIDRVDAVDAPATGRPFLLLKSGDPAEVAKNFEDLSGMVAAALKALQEDKVSLPAKSATALNGVSKLLNGADLFQPKAMHPGEECPPGQHMVNGQCVAKEPAAMAKEAPTGDQFKVDNTGVVTPATEKLMYETVKSLPEAVAKSLAPQFDALTAVLTKLTELATPAKAGDKPLKSNQVGGQDQIVKAAPKKMGEGLFANVLFGQTAQSGR